MYNEHFGLNEQPFGLTPDTHFFLNAQGYKEAFNMLQVALANGEGFIKVVGEVGTGKTMLCRKLLNTLDDNYHTAYIPNPYLNPEELYRAIEGELKTAPVLNAQDSVLPEVQAYLNDVVDGVSHPCESAHDYQKSINAKLIELVAQGKQVVLVVDEAQALSEEALEALRLISNLETEKTKLIHIVLFGQPELDVLLERKSIRQLKQRITFSFDLPALDKEGTRNYISHRAATAGYNGGALFTEKSLALIYKSTNGVPRLINILCHKALMVAYGKGSPQVDRPHLEAAIKDTDGVKMPAWFCRLEWSF